MLISVVPIGNSKGIRLPKAILEQLRITDTLDLEIEDQALILRPVKRQPRKGWEEEFKKMALNQEDKIIIEDVNEKEAFDWEW